MMTRALTLTAAALLLILSGLVHGLWTQRWGASAEFATAAARLRGFPTNLGKWAGRPLELDPVLMTQAEAAGYVARVFRHHTKGEVRMILICGRPGPISVHTPEVCFPGSGMAMEAKPAHHIFSSRDTDHADFLVGQFRNSGPVRRFVRAFWSFNDGSGWKTPGEPRVAFGRARILYKLYLVRDLEKPDESLKDDPARDLMRVLLPELAQCLSPASGAAASAE
jgi:hypothetical protein